MASPSLPAAWVVCLCAEWCGTCREYRTVFQTVADAHPSVQFTWLDVEDQPDLVGDLDVETFPTLVIGRVLPVGARVDFCGPVLPQSPVLVRLLTQLDLPGHGAMSAGAIDPEAQVLLARVVAAHTG